jgi:hypothetical protein
MPQKKWVPAALAAIGFTLATSAPSAAAPTPPSQTLCVTRACLQLPVQLSPARPAPASAPQDHQAVAEQPLRSPNANPPVNCQAPVNWCLGTYCGEPITPGGCVDFIETKFERNFAIKSPSQGLLHEAAVPSEPEVVTQTLYNVAGQRIRTVVNNEYPNALRASATGTSAPGSALNTATSKWDSVAQTQTGAAPTRTTASSGGNAGSAGQCAIDNPQATSDSNFIPYGNMDVGGGGDHSQTWYIYLLNGYNHARTYNGADHWQIEACFSGNSHAVDDDGAGWQLAFAGAAVAETNYPLHLINSDGTSGAAGPSLTTHLDFALDPSHGGIGVTAGESETTQAANYWANGSNAFIGVNADSYGPGNEVSAYWDGRNTPVPDAMGGAANALYEFDETDNSTKHIEGDAYLALKCTGADQYNSGCNSWLIEAD